MGSASRLRDGNQAKKAQLFKVSVFGSHAGPGSAKTDSFLCSPFLGPPPTSSLSGVVAGTGIELGTGYPEFVDHEVDGAFVGRPPRCDPKCGQRAGAKLDESELQGAQVQVSGGENVGVFHVHNLLGNINRSRCVPGWRTSPPLRGGSGAVLPAQRTQHNRCVRGRRTTLARPRDAAPLEGASGSVRLEAGSDSFALSFEQCESLIARSHRVNVTLLENFSGSSSCFRTTCTTHNSPACDTGVHDALRVIRLGRNSGNSSNSRGDTKDGGSLSCVYGGTKSLSTCTRTGVRRPAVEKLASSLKLHDETWAGLPMNLGPRIFREAEIVPGCAVRVACPSCPDYYPEPPGPGIVIRNMLGWSQLEKTERSGVWLFRGALQGENPFFSPRRSRRLGEERVVPHSVGGPCNSSCSCSYAYGHGPAIGPHSGERCWPLLGVLWRAIAPLMKPWCAEGDVPTAAKLNLYRGWKSCVGWHCDDEPLFGKCGDAKLIVSVGLGNFALFRWRRQSCSSNEDSSCRLDHGDILVMDGQCQDEFLHRTSPGREQDRINITFRWVKQNVASCPLFKAGVACCLPTCAQGSSDPVMGNVSKGVFWVFWFLLCVLCIWGVLVLPVSLLCTRLGLLRCASCWTCPLGRVRWGITFVTPGEGFLRFFIWDTYMLASVGQPSLHGYYACMVYWDKGALRRNCRLKQRKTSFFSFSSLSV